MKRVLSVLLVLFLVGCAVQDQTVSEVANDTHVPSVQALPRYENGAYSAQGFKEALKSLPSGVVMIQGYVYDKHNCYCPPGQECGPCFPSIGIADSMEENNYVSIDVQGAYPDVKTGELVRITAVFTQVSADLPRGHLVLKKIEKSS